MTDKSQWWMIVRRSFGVPDLVADEVAYERIASLLAPDPAVDFGGDAGARNRWVQGVVEQVVELGVEGELDVFLAGERELEEAAQAVSKELSLEGPGTGKPLPTAFAVREVLEMVRGFVGRHPFDATAPYVAEQPVGG